MLASMIVPISLGASHERNRRVSSPTCRQEFEANPASLDSQSLEGSQEHVALPLLESKYAQHCTVTETNLQILVRDSDPYALVCTQPCIPLHPNHDENNHHAHPNLDSKTGSCKQPAPRSYMKRLKKRAPADGVVGDDSFVFSSSSHCGSFDALATGNLNPGSGVSIEVSRQEHPDIVTVIAENLPEDKAAAESQPKPAWADGPVKSPKPILSPKTHNPIGSVSISPDRDFDQLSPLPSPKASLSPGLFPTARKRCSESLPAIFSSMGNNNNNDEGRTPSGNKSPLLSPIFRSPIFQRIGSFRGNKSPSSSSTEISAFNPESEGVLVTPSSPALGHTAEITSRHRHSLPAECLATSDDVDEEPISRSRSPRRRRQSFRRRSETAAGAAHSPGANSNGGKDVVSLSRGNSECVKPANSTLTSSQTPRPSWQQRRRNSSTSGINPKPVFVQEEISAVKQPAQRKSSNKLGTVSSLGLPSTRETFVSLELGPPSAPTSKTPNFSGAEPPRTGDSDVFNFQGVISSLAGGGQKRTQTTSNVLMHISTTPHAPLPSTDVGTPLEHSGRETHIPEPSRSSENFYEGAPQRRTSLPRTVHGFFNERIRPLSTFFGRFTVTCGAAVFSNVPSKLLLSVPLSAYGFSLVRRMRLTNGIVALALAYAHRMVDLKAAAKTEEDKKVCGHCLLTVCLMLAAKYLMQDVAPGNSEWAFQSRLPPTEIDQLEATVMQALEFQLQVARVDFQWVLEGMLTDPHRAWWLDVAALI